VELDLLAEQDGSLSDLVKVVLEGIVYVLVEAFQKSRSAAICVPSHELGQVREDESVEAHGKLLESWCMECLTFLDHADCIVDIGHTLREGLSNFGVVGGRLR
jgi:hypothetical protein